MKFKIFKRANFLGEYSKDLVLCKNVIATGTVINVCKDKYIVLNIMIRRKDEVILEVNSK